MKTALRALTLVTLAACGHDDMDMNHSLGEVETHIAGLRAESGSHRQQVAEAVDPIAARGLEAGHYDRSMGRAEGMAGNMKDMHMCRISLGGAPDLAGMADEIGQLRIECDGHRNAMARSTDMPTLRAEEDRHQTAMGTLFGRMDQTQQKMMTGAGSYVCPMHGGH